MTLTATISQIEKVLADRSPEILTGVGVAGTLMTAVLTGQAAMKYERLLNDTGPHLTAKERFEVSWTLWIPPVASGVLTVTSIVLANRIGSRRTAAMAAAYVLSEKAFSEYRDQVREKLGKNKERAIRDDVAQEQVRRNPVTTSEVIITGDGNVLCYDALSGRYFRSDMESIKKAMNDLNYKINNHYFASLADWYDLLGLPLTELSHELGWNSDELLEVHFTTVLAENGHPAISINYKTVPIRGYCRVS